MPICFFSHVQLFCLQILRSYKFQTKIKSPTVYRGWQERNMHIAGTSQFIDKLITDISFKLVQYSLEILYKSEVCLHFRLIHNLEGFVFIFNRAYIQYSYSLYNASKIKVLLIILSCLNKQASLKLCLQFYRNQWFKSTLYNNLLNLATSLWATLPNLDKFVTFIFLISLLLI